MCLSRKYMYLLLPVLFGTTSLDHFNFSSWKLNPRSGQTVGMKSQRIVLSPPLSSLFCFLFCGWIIFSSSYFTERIVLRGSWSASSQLPNMGPGFFLLSTKLDLIILFSYHISLLCILPPLVNKLLCRVEFTESCFFTVLPVLFLFLEEDVTSKYITLFSCKVDSC